MQQMNNAFSYAADNTFNRMYIGKVRKTTTTHVHSVLI
ncbi:Uncharacterized protein BM_BM17388 [Brugia malayi]|uniref:Uncharacterized protein n=1 Tax=Brugia malayi TaxID=6279 RepID=A0A4E9F6H8_BRUMA|nr:Uncharacterized protein BM_BM17388 [Brugia malayi]VIO91541.1 Uncharacterized protein BM_BM17388 [Brugia malayi]